MNEVLRLLSFPAVALIGWLVSCRNSELARKSGRALPVVLVGIFLGVAISGWMARGPAVSSVHKWTGHGLVIAVWLFVPFSAGVALQRHIPPRPRIAITQLIVVLLLLGAVLLSAFTGYLAPSDTEDVARETRHRFIVLHLFALPSLIAILLCIWHWLPGPRAHYAAEQTLDRSGRFGRNEMDS